jgi:Na+/alanine symporter
MDLFISEQDEKADMDTRVKSLLVNLSSISFTLIVLVEGVWSLIQERVELAIPFLSLSFILAISHLYLRKFTSVLHQNYLLSVLFITCSFFILFGGNTGIGIVWTFLFPFFATALRGRNTGTYWSLTLAFVIILHIYILQDLRPFFKATQPIRGSTF